MQYQDKQANKEEEEKTKKQHVILFVLEIEIGNIYHLTSNKEGFFFFYITRVILYSNRALLLMSQGFELMIFRTSI